MIVDLTNSQANSEDYFAGKRIHAFDIVKFYSDKYQQILGDEDLGARALLEYDHGMRKISLAIRGFLNAYACGANKQLNYSDIYDYIEWCIGWSKTKDAAWLSSGINIWLIFNTHKPLCLEKYLKSKMASKNSDLNWQNPETWNKYLENRKCRS